MRLTGRLSFRGPICAVCARLHSKTHTEPPARVAESARRPSEYLLTRLVMLQRCGCYAHQSFGMLAFLPVLKSWYWSHIQPAFADAAELINQAAPVAEPTPKKAKKDPKSKDGGSGDAAQPAEELAAGADGNQTSSAVASNAGEGDENDATAAQKQRKGRHPQRAATKDVQYQEPGALHVKHIKTVEARAAVKLANACQERASAQMQAWQPQLGAAALLQSHVTLALWPDVAHRLQELECKSEGEALQATAPASGLEAEGKRKRRLIGLSVVDAHGQGVAIQKIGLKDCPDCYITGTGGSPRE